MTQVFSVRSPRVRFAGVLLSLSIIPSISLRGQTATGEGHFPFVDCCTVDWMPADPENGVPTLAIVGSGGGIVALDVSNPSDPKPYRPTSYSNPEGVYMRTGGMVRKLRVHGERVYVAAGPAGFLRFARPGWTRDALVSVNGNAWALAVVTVDDKTRVIVGTNDDYASGSLALVDPDASVSQLLSTVSGLSPVYAVAAYVYTDPTTQAKSIRVLAGTACGGVKRYVIDAGPENKFDALVSTGSGGTWGGSDTFVRDIEIDPDADPDEHRAYVALYGATVPSGFSVPKKGVYALRIKSDGTLEEIGSPWPIVPSAVIGSAQCHALAFDDAAGRLVVGFEPKYYGERIYSGSCDRPFPCDCGAAGGCSDPLATCDGNEDYLAGMDVYRIDASGNPVSEVDFDSFQDTGSSEPFYAIDPIDLALRTVSSELFYVDLVGLSVGYRLVEVDDIAPGGSVSWDPAEVGDFAYDEGPAPPGQPGVHALPLFTSLNLHVQGDALYVATDYGVETFDRTLSLPSDPHNPANLTLLEQPASKKFVFVADDSPQPANLTGFPSPSARLYAPAAGGIRFFNVDGALEFDPKLVTASLDTGGRCFNAVATFGFENTTPPPEDPPRWLYASNNLDDASSPGAPSGGVVLFDVGTAGARPGDPLTSVAEVVRYVHQDASNPDVKPATFHGLAVRPVSETAHHHAVYVAYSAPAGAGSETSIGIVVLRVNHVVALDEYEIEFVKKVPAAFAAGACAYSGSVCPQSQAGRVTFDADAPDHARLYVAFGCNGMAMYDATDPWDPECEGWRPSPAGGTAYHILRGPASGGTHRLFLSFLHETGPDRGIGVINDLANFTSETIHYFPLPSQVTGIALEPFDSSRQTLYAAGVHAGTFRIRITP